MSQTLLVINAGSSSIKFELFQLDLTPLLMGQIDGINANPRFKARNQAGELVLDQQPDAGQGYNHAQALSSLLDWLLQQPQTGTLAAAGHRVVHGGDRYARPVLLNDAVLADLEQLVPLAPLHQPHNLAAIQALRALQPALPQVACFDTAFHQTQPEVARRFGIPRALHAQGIKRYGFHGLSYEFIAQHMATVVGASASQGRVLVAHLGNGASMCAIQGGHSVASSMGFTALDGLMMGSRTGSIDPGVLLHLLGQPGQDVASLTKLLYKESGLLGVSGISADMRELLASAEPAAAEAVELFCYRAVREIGSLTAAMGGLDALIFTGGIGEHAPPVRERILRELAWLGIELDEAANNGHGPRLSTPESRASAWVIPTDEEKMIASHTQRLLAGS